MGQLPLHGVRVADSLGPFTAGTPSTRQAPTDAIAGIQDTPRIAAPGTTRAYSGNLETGRSQLTALCRDSTIPEPRRRPFGRMPGEEFP